MLPDASDVEPMPEREPDHEFWSQSTQFEHIHKFARSRGASPYATLGCVLRRVTGCVAPNVVLPPVVGGRVSLNLFTAAVGVSGAGKDIANAAGRDACSFYRVVGTMEEPIAEAAHVHPGSGEGLARIFKGHGDSQAALIRAHLQVPDVATLEALAARQGATLVGQLLAGYMGQPIGFTNNSKDTTTGIDAHSYRLCLSIGVQPDNARFFLDREKDGFPQRFLWLPTNDPGAPEARPEPVSPESFELPNFGSDVDTPVVMEIPDDVAADIWRHRWQVLTGADGIDPLDAHIKLAQLKTAASIAILHGSTHVTDDAWKLAGQLVDVSTGVRDGLRATVSARSRRENTAKALDQADRDAIVRERLSDDSQKRVAQAVTRKLKRVGAATRHDLRVACDSSIRRDFPTVFDLFIDKGFVELCEGSDGHAHRYQLVAQ
jgi:hypothetical protein